MLEPSTFVTTPTFWIPDYLREPDSWVGHIPFAFWIIDALQPRTLVELGTHSGNSYLAFCQTVQKLCLDTTCFAIDTWKGDAQAGFYGEEVFLELSNYHNERYGSFSQLIRSTFDEAVNYFPDDSFDLLHIDGLHSYEAVKHDFETWFPKLSERSVVLFHDINVRKQGFGVWQLWDELSERYPSFSFLHSYGLGIIGIGNNLPKPIENLLDASKDPYLIESIRNQFARLGLSLVQKLANDQLKDRNLQLSNQLEQSQAQLHKAHEAWEQSQAQLQKIQEDRKKAYAIIRGMESSKFWQLRQFWQSLKLKQFFGLPTDDNL